MTGAAPAGVELLTCLNRLELRFDSAASLVASDAHDDPATLEWGCRAVLPLWEPDDAEARADNARLLGQGMSLAKAFQGQRQELTILSMSGLTLDLWRIGHIYASLDSRDADYEHFAPSSTSPAISAFMVTWRTAWSTAPTSSSSIGHGSRLPGVACAASAGC
ncbi:hypothetical protein ACWCPO_21715 [Streptomyces albidoflavus]